MVVDTSMGFNKANIYLDRQTTYHLSLTNEAAPQAKTVITYTHTGQDNGKACNQNFAEEYANAKNYLDVADQCYFNYLRIYTPAGSLLINSSEHTVPGEALLSGNLWRSQAQTVNEFQGLTTFANFLLVPRGQTVEAFFEYQLPTTVVQNDGSQKVYRLTLAKQPGTETQPVTVTIELPPDAELLLTSLPPRAIAGSQLEFRLDLNADVFLEIVYR